VAFWRVSTNDFPIPNATAPAFLKSPIFVKLMPPVGIRGMYGKGASTSLMNDGPPELGNTLIKSPPFEKAENISVGV